MTNGEPEGKPLTVSTPLHPSYPSACLLARGLLQSTLLSCPQAAGKAAGHLAQLLPPAPRANRLGLPKLPGCHLLAAPCSSNINNLAAAREESLRQTKKPLPWRHQERIWCVGSGLNTELGTRAMTPLVLQTGRTDLEETCI